MKQAARRPEPPQDFTRLFPPRAKAAVNPEQIDRFRGYVAQYKYNDIRTLVHLTPDSGILLFTRVRERVKEYRLTSGMERSLRGLDLDPDRYHVLDGGILRWFPASERPIVLWDILVHENRYLIGTSYQERYELLAHIAGSPRTYEDLSGHRVGLKIEPFLWLAPTFAGDFRARFDEVFGLEYMEGLMFKNPRARLEPGYIEANNASWQVKVRKQAKAYRF